MTRTSPTQFALALLAVTGLAGSAAAQAGISHFERNGYNLCMAAADQSLRGLAEAPQFYINEGSDSRSYYINGTAWADDGSRRAVRVACRTSLNGHRLLSLDTQNGQYARAETSGKLIIAAN